MQSPANSAFAGIGRRAALVAAAVALGSCETIEVLPQDDSGPELTVFLVNPSGMRAEYRDGRREPVVGLIAQERTFAIRLYHPRQSVAFVFSAVDRQTGIQDGVAQISVAGFDCLYLYPDERVPRRVRAEGEVSFISPFGSPPAAPGTRTSPSAATGVVFDLPGIWEQGRCADRAPRPAPYRRGIWLTRATYSVGASNNGTSRVHRSADFLVEEADSALYLDR